MTDSLRPDGRPFVFDSRGECPRYVVEDDEDGTALVINQFTGRYEVVGARPYSVEALIAAHGMLRRAERRGSKT